METQKVYLSYGAKSGDYVPVEEAIKLPFLCHMTGEYTSYVHKDNEMVSLSEHSIFYTETCKEIPIENAVSTVDGYVFEGEAVAETIYGQNVLHRRLNSLGYVSALNPHDPDIIVYCKREDSVMARDNNNDYERYYNCEDYYFTEALDDNDDIILFYNDDCAAEAGFMYNESRGYYIIRGSYVEGYGNFDHPDYSNGSNFKFGVEVEKEDYDELVGSYAREVYAETGWAKETDGSLNDAGYELISPIYDLMDLSQFKSDITNNSTLKYLINADYSDSCGGHITISSNEMTAGQLFSGIRAYIPLLYSLYPSRTSKNYSKAKSIYTLGYEPEKYSGIYLKSGLSGRLLEFRIFPAFRNVSNMIWRLELIQLMLKNIGIGERDVLKQILNKKSKLSIHLRNMYKANGGSVDKRMLDLSTRYINNCLEYNHVKINASTVTPVSVKKRK